MKRDISQSDHTQKPNHNNVNTNTNNNNYNHTTKKAKRQHVEIVEDTDDSEHEIESITSDSDSDEIVSISSQQQEEQKGKKANAKTIKRRNNRRRNNKWRKAFNPTYDPSKQPEPKYPSFDKLRIREDFTDFYRKNLKPEKDDLCYYFVDAEYCYQKGSGTVINVTGNIYPNWAPILLQVTGVRPWFAIKKPERYEKYDIEFFIRALNKGLMTYVEIASKKNTDLKNLLLDMQESETGPIISWSIINEQELVEYKGEPSTDFIKIVLVYPKLVKMARDLIEHPDGRAKIPLQPGAQFESTEIPSTEWCPEDIRHEVLKMQLFEADVDFIIRYISDTYSTPCTFFTVPAGSYDVIGDSDNRKCSRTNLEIAVDTDKIKPVTDPKFSKIIPNFVRIVFDFEMSTSGLRFPDPKKDPILQLSIIVSDLLGEKPKRKYMFCLSYVKEVESCDCVFWYTTEESLLLAIKDFFLAIDPDVWSHHNGNGFDIKYLLERAEYLGLGKDFGKMGRMLYRNVKVNKSQNKGFTKYSAIVPGILNLDIYRKAQEDTKLDTGYNLRALSEAYLDGMTKGEIHYSLISKYQETEVGRTKLAVYCMLDTICTDAILEKKKYIENCLGFGRMTNCTAQRVLDRAQGAKLDAKLKLFCSKRKCTVDGCTQADCKHEKNGKKKLMITSKVKRVEKTPTVYWEVQTEKLDPKDRKAYMEKMKRILVDPEARFMTQYDNQVDGENKAEKEDGMEDGTYQDNDEMNTNNEDNDDDDQEYINLAESIRRDVGRTTDMNMDVEEGEEEEEENRQAGVLSAYDEQADVSDLPNDMFEDMAQFRRENPGDSDESYDGATVLKPKCGFYGPTPIVTLDFASMYPSIIRAFNVCYSTFVTNETIRKLGLLPSYYNEKGELIEMDYWRRHDFVVEDGVGKYKANFSYPAFLTKSRLAGVLPELETDLGNQRKAIKKQMEALDKQIGNLCAELGITTLMNEKDELEIKLKTATKSKDKSLEDALKAKIGKIKDDIAQKKKLPEYKPAIVWQREKDMLDIDQNVIKGIMNSMYGITGDPTSKYYFKPIATTITGCGRNMISQIKYIVETTFNKENGWWFDAEVIYGDTDSILILLNGFCDDISDPASRGEASAVGNYMANYTTKQAFKDPIKLEFEKIYDNFNMIGPKNYTGRKWVINELDPKCDIKGLAMIKRGPCKFIKETCKRTNEMIIKEDDYEGAMKYAADRFDMLDMKMVPIGDLIEVQKLSKPLTDYGKEQIVTDSFGKSTKKKGSLSPYVKLAMRQTFEEKTARRKLTYNLILGELHQLHHEKDKNKVFEIIQSISKEDSISQNTVKDFIRNHTNEEIASEFFRPIGPSEMINRINSVNFTKYLRLDQYFPFMVEVFMASIGVTYTIGTFEKRFAELYDDSDVVNAGDVISVVVVKKHGQAAMQKDATKNKGDNVEDPMIVFKNDLPIDYDYYKKSLQEQLTKVIGNVVEYHNPTKYKSVRIDPDSMFNVENTTFKRKRSDSYTDDDSIKFSTRDISDSMRISVINEGDLGAKKKQHEKEAKKMRKKFKDMKDNYTHMDDEEYLNLQREIEKRKVILKGINQEIKNAKDSKKRKVIDELTKRSKKKKKLDDAKEGQGIMKFMKKIQECVVCGSILIDTPASHNTKVSKPSGCDKCGASWGTCKHRSSVHALEICEGCFSTIDTTAENEKQKYVKLKETSEGIWKTCIKCMNGNVEEARNCATLQCKYHSIRHVTDRRKDNQEANLNILKSKCGHLLKDPKILEW